MRGTEPEESRGTRVYLWSDGESECSFCPSERDVYRYEIQAPIGWSAVPDPVHGIVLRSSSAPTLRLKAAEVVEYAFHDRAGFRLLSEYEFDS